MRRQGALKALVDKGDFVVESDVANFFVYVNHDRLLALVAERSILDRDCVGLLALVLQAFIPQRDYSVPGPQGLVQGNHDASRILAHVYLDLFDEAFDEEGKRGRYSRWVDDLIVSVTSEVEAIRVIARIQLALEPLGLAPNAGKTRFLRKRDWEGEHYPDFNRYLDLVEARLEAGGSINEGVFVNRFKDFLKGPRTRYWVRVLRRSFTAAKAIGTPGLRRYVPRLVREAPDATRWFLNYLSIFSLTARSVDVALDLINELGGVYQDMEILVLEYLLHAPNKNRRALRKRLADWSRTRLSELVGLDDPVSAYISGLITLVLFKFGFAADMQFVYSLYERRLPSFDDFAKYAFVCLGAIPRYRARMVQSISGVDDSSVMRIAHGLDSLERATKREFGGVRDYLRVIEKDRPKRQVFRARALPCLSYLARADGIKADYLQFLRNARSKLGDSAGAPRDERSIALIDAVLRAAQ